MNTKSIIVPGVITPDGRLELTKPPDLPPGPVEVTIAVVAPGENGIPITRQPREARIIDRGRGPEIAGTRITVYDVLDYYRHGHHHTYIAALFRLSSDEILAAIKYIEEHKEEVMADYRVILEREARGNPPELQAKLDAISEKCQALWAEKRRQKQMPEVNGEGNPGRQ